MFAYYHSLRMRPIYLNAHFHAIIQDLAVSEDVGDSLQSLAEVDRVQATAILDALIEHKILSTEKDYDERVLARFRQRLPKPYIQIAYFVLTEVCNLACSYCFIENKMDVAKPRERVMTKETAKQALDFFCGLIARDPDLFEEEKNIILYGGEPLTNYDTLKYLLGLIAQYKAAGLLPARTDVSIITNGTLMTPEIASELKNSEVSVSVSLDGSTECSNSCRVFRNGALAYDRILQGVETAARIGCQCGLSVTLTEETIKDFAQIKELVERYKVTSLGFNILMTDETFRVGPTYNDEASEFIIRAFEYFREQGIYEDRIMRKVKAFADAKVYLYDCGALGGNQVVIAPDGQVGICHGYLHNREYFPTSVYDVGFDPALDRVYTEWALRTPINMNQCVDCEALGICGGGCPLNARNNGTNNSIWDLDERFCVHAKKTLEWLIWDLHKTTLS